MRRNRLDEPHSAVQSPRPTLQNSRQTDTAPIDQNRPPTPHPRTSAIPQVDPSIDQWRATRTRRATAPVRVPTLAIRFLGAKHPQSTQYRRKQAKIAVLFPPWNPCFLQPAFHQVQITRSTPTCGNLKHSHSQEIKYNRSHFDQIHQPFDLVPARVHSPTSPLNQNTVERTRSTSFQLPHLVKNTKKTTTTKIKKVRSPCGSQLVPHASTKPAQDRLASQFGMRYGILGLV